MQRDRLSQLLERTPDVAFALTARADIWAWNGAAEAITGFARADALHRSFPQLVKARGPLGKLLDAEYCERAIRVASELGISSQTLRNHLYHVNQKLGTHNRLEAVVHAVRRGLI